MASENPLFLTLNKLKERTQICRQGAGPADPFPTGPNGEVGPDLGLEASRKPEEMG